MSWLKLKEEAVKVGYKWVTKKTFIDESGSEVEFTTWYKTGSKSAAVVAMTKEGSIVVAKQYRPGPEKILYELPGGGVEEGEDPAEAAARELSEETGYMSDEPLVEIGQNCADAYTNNTNHYFLAQNCYKASEQQLDNGEFVEVVELGSEELIGIAKTGLMSDAAAVLCAYDHLRSHSK